MAFSIEYYKEGVRKGARPHAGPLEKIKEFVKDAFIRHDVDFARVIDVDGSGAEVWSARRDSPET
jgi:hypothetical protein